MGITQPLDLIHARLCPYVPQLDDTIATDTAQLCIFDWVECNLFDTSSMPLEFG